MSMTLIDWSQPIELDDGRPVRVDGTAKIGEGAIVWVDGPWKRGGSSRDNGRWGYNAYGIWAGGSAEENYFIRNVSNEKDYDNDFE
jgi:hypothetical protein